MADVAKGIIDIEINTGAASAQIKSLQSQINAFNLSLSKQNKNQALFAADYARELQLAISKTGAFTAETVKLSTAAATLDKTLSRGRTSLGQFFSAKFNKDSAVAVEVMGLAAERARSMQTQFIATSGAAKGMQEALAIRPMAAFSSEMAVAAQRSEILSSMFKQGTTQLINFGKNVQWAGRQLMVGFTVPLTIFGTAAGKTFMELEKQMVSFKKVYGDITTTPAQLNQNLEAVKGLAAEYTKYGVAVKDTIGLAAQAAAAGRQNKDLTDAVSQATRLATLGQMDQNAALETTISLQSAFKLSGKDLADTINFLNMVENQTVVSLQDISAAIPRVAPVIQGLGGDVKDLTVFLAAMQEGGVDAAEGANALKSGLASLINPTKQATEMLSGMGINLQTIIEANKGDLMGTVMSFSKALQGLDQFSRQQALEQVFGKFQYAKLGALFENISRQGSQAQQVIATMGYSTEQLGATADKELKAIEQSFGVQLTAAVEKFKLAIAPIGEIFVKTAIPIVNFLTDIINKFNGLSEGKKQFIALATVIAGVLIPVGTMLFGLLMNLSGTLLKMGQGMTMFTKGLITGGPLGAIKALTQGSKYLSLSEIDAAMAAQQLAGSSEAVNAALLGQVSSAAAAQTAINSLIGTYEKLIAAQMSASQYSSFAAPGAAASAAKNIKTGGSGFKGLKRNKGGLIPGVGNTDSVPALLTPGESVMTKEATKKYGRIINAMNSGKLPGFNLGVTDVNLAGNGSAVEMFGKLSNEEEKIIAQSIKVVQESSPAKNKTSEVTIKDLEERRKLSKSKGTFAHMQRNLVGGEGAIISGQAATDVFEEIAKSPDLTDLERGYLKALKPSGYAGSRITGNLGFNISSYLNSGTNNISYLLDDLSWRMQDGRNPYKEMLTAIGINEKDIDAVSKKVHERVKLRLKAMQRAGALTYKDVDLYQSMEKVVPIALKNSGKESSIEKLFSMSSISRAKGLRIGGITQKVSELAKQAGVKIAFDSKSDSGSNKYKMDGLSKLLSSRGTSASVAKLMKINPKSEILQQLLGGGLLKRNTGGVIPGSGNRDTVPAMLTPGEFVVNKEATKENYDLLNKINNGAQSQKFIRGGKVLSAAAQVGGMAAMMSGNPMLMGAGMIAQMLPGLISGARGGDGGQVNFSGAIKGAGQSLKNIATVGGRLSIGMTSMAGGVALAGFAIYKLNKSVNEAQKAGGELAKAMNGSADRTTAMAEAFGRETYADAARRRAVEKAGGQEISQEAQQQSSQFMQSDASKTMIADLELVKEKGKNVAEALRNQLATSIIAGAITTEEARAIAIDMGKALNDESIAVKVSGEITRLMGPDGKDMLKNLSKITTEINPKIDSNALNKEAQAAFDKLNPFQKGWQTLLGGQDEFKAQYSIDSIADTNAAALGREAEARQLLNAALEEGTISLKQYMEQEAAISTGAKTRSGFVADANAKAMGFASAEDMKNQAVELQKNIEIVNTPSFGANGSKYTSEQRQAAQRAIDLSNTDGTKAAYDATFTKDKEALKQSFVTSGMSEEAAAQTISGVESGLAKVDPTIFTRMLSQEISQENIQVLLDIQGKGGIESSEELDKIIKQLNIVSKFPDIDKMIGFDMTNKEQLGILYDEYMKFEEAPDLWKGVKIQDQFSGVFEKFGIDYAWLSSLPNVEKFAILRNLTIYETVNKEANGKDSDRAAREANTSAYNTIMSQISSSKLGQIGKAPATGNTSGGGGGGKTLEDMKKNLMNRFDLVDKRLSLEQEKYQKIIDLQERQNTLDERSIDLNNHALSQLTKQEDAINKRYDNRIRLLDEVANSNDRLRDQESSRIDLARALAEGNVSTAAQIMSQMTANEANYRIEDTRAALEKQKEEELKNLKIEVNGQLLTREQIQANIDTIEEQIYQRNLANQGVQDQIYQIEQQRLANSKEREKVETRMYLLEQRKAILELQKKGKKLTNDEKQALADFKQGYNSMADYFNQMFGENIQKVMYGGTIKKFAMGNVVPGSGNTDRVPALLTPGEFVVRKSAAQSFMPLLNMINNGTMPTLSPSYNVPSGSAANVSPSVSNSSVMYNDTYNINVNVGGANASPDDIANVVMSKLSQLNRGSVRSIRY